MNELLFLCLFFIWEKIRAVLVGKETESVCVLLVYLPPELPVSPGGGDGKKREAEHELVREPNPA